MTSKTRKLLDDCFLHDSERMRHNDVLALLRERLSPVTGVETVPLDEALGRTLAETVSAPRDVPLDDNSAVDGYAFAHASYLALDGRLKLSGRLAAGETMTEQVAPGHCVRIFTGAPLPGGTDTVAMQEDCDRSQEERGLVSIPPGLRAGANRRRAGEDLTAGEDFLADGTTLKPADIAALASVGLAHVAVRERLRIGILSTGNEIVPAGEPLSSGQVYDANGPMLRALATSPKTSVINLGHVVDSEEQLVATLSAASKRCDLILTSGGASRGEEDHALAALDQLGKRHLWQIAVKPGRPMMFGQIGDTVVIALPGNPVAAMVCFLLYVRPVIALMTGTRYGPPVGMDLPADFEIEKKKTGRREFLRGWRQVDETTGKIMARKFERDGSGLISGLRAAEGLIELPEDVTAVKRGSTVRFIPFSDLEL